MIRSFLLVVAVLSPAGLAGAQSFDVTKFDRERVLKAANQYLSEAPLTITASSSSRSAGGLHDFFSEGDYWWPDPQNPDGPYIQRDGMTNPDNFTDHRRYLMRLSVQVPALVAAWRLTREERYAAHAARHLRAWFLDEKTRMNPHLKFAQAIKGRVTGRGIGIIDTIHLVEVARAIESLEGSTALSKAELSGIKQWFADYLTWMTRHPYGIEEREAKNNHGTCWVMQVAAYARLTGNRELVGYCRERFKTVLIPNQMAADGSFPQELRRTKPYGYSLFNLDAMATICQLLSTRQDDLWTFELADGRGMRKALAFMTPYIRDKKSWPLKPDVMYDQEWPMRHAGLLFAGMAFDRHDYLELWKTLRADSTVEEVVRNFFIRQPVLWTGARTEHKRVGDYSENGSSPSRTTGVEMNDSILRQNLGELLRGGHAHLTPEQALNSLAPSLRNTRPASGLHSVWEELEHMRIAQEDILRYTLDASWVSPVFPEGYWPKAGGDLTEAAWAASVAAFFADLEAVIKLVEDQNLDLTAEIPHGEGRTYLREILLVADHNSYHLGQIVQTRKALGAWGG